MKSPIALAFGVAGLAAVTAAAISNGHVAFLLCAIAVLAFAAGCVLWLAPSSPTPEQLQVITRSAALSLAAHHLQREIGETVLQDRAGLELADVKFMTARPEYDARDRIVYDCRLYASKRDFLRVVFEGQPDVPIERQQCEAVEEVRTLTRTWDQPRSLKREDATS